MKQRERCAITPGNSHHAGALGSSLQQEGEEQHSETHLQVLQWSILIWSFLYLLLMCFFTKMLNKQKREGPTKAKQSLTKQGIHWRRKQVKLHLPLSHSCRREHESYSYTAFSRTCYPQIYFISCFRNHLCLWNLFLYFFDILEHQGLPLCQQDPPAWLPLQTAAGSLIVLNL